MKHRPLLFLSAAALSAFASAQDLDAAVIAYSNDFSSESVTFPNQSGLAAGGGVATAGVSGSATNQVDYGSEQFTNVANTSYLISVQFQVTDLGGTTGATNTENKSVGLALFSSASNYSNTSGNSYVLFDFIYLSNQSGDRGLMRLRHFSTTTTSLATNLNIDIGGANPLAVEEDTTYTLKLLVTNTGTNSYSLTGGIYDASGTTQFGSSITTTADHVSTVTNPYMGVRSNFSNTTGNGNVWYDNYTITPIPESSAGLLLGLGAGTIGLVRRRRR